MRYTGLCLISNDVPRLVSFYKRIFDTNAEGDDLHSVLKIKELELTIFAATEMEKMAPNSTKGMGAGNTIIGFEVEDVDAEYERIQPFGVRIIMYPTTHPWNSRSFWFSDPDGNIIDFFAKQ